MMLLADGSSCRNSELKLGWFVGELKFKQDNYVHVGMELSQESSFSVTFVKKPFRGLPGTGRESENGR